MSAQLFKNTILLLANLFLALSIVACASTAPVQEMSNARQTIAAAQEAEAKKYAPEQLELAENLMQQATEALESGDYQNARDLAVSAQQHAIKARQLAVAAKKK